MLWNSYDTKHNEETDWQTYSFIKKVLWKINISKKNYVEMTVIISSPIFSSVLKDDIGIFVVSSKTSLIFLFSFEYIPVIYSMFNPTELHCKTLDNDEIKPWVNIFNFDEALQDKIDDIRGRKSNVNSSCWD